MLHSLVDIVMFHRAEFRIHAYMEWGGIKNTETRILSSLVRLEGYTQALTTVRVDMLLTCHPMIIKSHRGGCTVPLLILCTPVFGPCSSYFVYGGSVEERVLARRRVQTRQRAPEKGASSIKLLSETRGAWVPRIESSLELSPDSHLYTPSPLSSRCPHRRARRRWRRPERSRQLSTHLQHRTCIALRGLQV